MIKCPKGCPETPVPIFRSAVEPANDVFRCPHCRHEWKRYDGTKYERPEDARSE